MYMRTDEIKKLYDADVQTKFNGSYEYHRWASTPIQKAQFRMTRDTIRRFVPKSTKKARRILELGPGPGTWTKELLRLDSHAHVDAVDISSEMLDQARKMLAGRSMISFYQSDFMSFRTVQRYDMFFSSRAIEYFPDKAPAAKKIFDALLPGGRAFLITKMPHGTRGAILGRKLGSMHGGQIAPRDLRNIFWNAGFKEVRLYPATINIPLINSAFLSKALFALLGRLPLNPISAFFSESYCIVATKR